MTAGVKTNRFGKRYTGYIPGHDDLVDPTACEVISWAGLLANVLHAQRGQTGSRWCTDRDLFRSTLDAAETVLHELDADLHASRGASLSQRHAELASHVFNHVRTVHNRCTVNKLNFRFGRYELDAAHLVRVTNAAVQGTCLAGQSHPVACTTGPGRVRLRVTDELGAHDDQDHGCVWHVAEQHVRWDPLQVRFTLIGPSRVAGEVLRLAAGLESVRREGQPVGEFDDTQRRAAAARAGCPYPGVR